MTHLEGQGRTRKHSFVRFYPSDWLAGTARLPRLHKSIYFDVCCYVWDNARPVPAIELMVMVSDVPNGMEIVDQLVAMTKLIRLDDGSISNHRAQAEATCANSAWKAMVEGGSKGGSKGGLKGDEGTLEGGVEGKRTRAKSQEPRTKTSPNGEGLPPDFEPILTAKAQENWNRLEHPERELDKFKDHAAANDRKAKDWQAAFRTWLSNAVTYQEQRNGTGVQGRGGNGADKRSGLARALDRELAGGALPALPQVPALLGGDAPEEGGG